MRSCSYSIVHSFSAHLLQLPPTTTLQRKALRLKDSRSKNAKVVLLAHGETDLRVLIQGHISFNMPSEAERGNVCHHCTVKLFIHPPPALSWRKALQCKHSNVLQNVRVRGFFPQF